MIIINITRNEKIKELTLPAFQNGYSFNSLMHCSLNIKIQIYITFSKKKYVDIYIIH